MSFKELKKLLPEWPEAVDPKLICEPDEKNKLLRGQDIVSYFLPSLSGKKFLDFGCGEGHVVQVAQADALLAKGYDIRPNGKLWGEATFLTNDLNEVRRDEPYDVILLYDVLDHCENPVEVLKIIRNELLAEKGTVHVLTHPWCGRHSGHTYRSLNHAYAHIIFSDEELVELGVDLKDYPVQKVIYPIATYEKWIKKAGFEITYNNVIRDVVDDFFNTPIIKQRIKQRFQSINAECQSFPQFQLEQSFHEFILKSNAVRRQSEIQILTDLLESSAWPNAVDPITIASESEEDQIERAQAILGMLLPDLTGRFLDFGCGDGFLVKEASKTVEAFGYDIKSSQYWTGSNFSTDLMALDKPYDVVLLHDILDHAENPVEVLEQVHRVCHNKSKIIVRTHPWCSRHGGHLFKQKNKAFIHLVFSEEELKNFGLSIPKTKQVTTPIRTYNNYFKQTGFKVVKEEITRQSVERFFVENKLIANRIKKRWNRHSSGEFPSFQMEQNFLDFTLVLA